VSFRASGRRFVRQAIGHPVLTSIALAVVVRSICLVAVSITGVDIALDETTYFRAAHAASRGELAALWDGYGQQLYEANRAYLAPIAALFEVVTPSLTAGRVVSVALGSMTAGLVALVVSQLAPTRWALTAGAVVALVPSQVWWSTGFLRESAIWLACVGTWLAVASLARGGYLPLAGLAFGALLVGALAYMRGQTMVVVLLAFLLAGIVLARTWPIRVGVVMIAVAVPLATGYGVFGWTLLREVDESGAARGELAVRADSALVDLEPLDPSSAAAVEARRIDATRGRHGSGARARAARQRIYVEDEGGTRIAVIVLRDGTVYRVDDGAVTNLRRLPGAMIDVALRPFPWERASGTSVRLAALESPLWLLLFAAASVGLVAGRRRWRSLAFPALFVGGMVVAAALTQGNLGTAFRHRGQLVWAVAALIAVGLGSARWEPSRG